MAYKLPDRQAAARMRYQLKHFKKTQIDNLPDGIAKNEFLLVVTNFHRLLGQHYCEPCGGRGHIGGAVCGDCGGQGV